MSESSGACLDGTLQYLRAGIGMAQTHSHSQRHGESYRIQSAGAFRG
jgi:hypothetical protein